jgi:hypothetical protein
VLASAALPNRLAHATRAVLGGLWLGLLSDASLRALDEAYYSRTDLYRTADWNERGLFDWERELIEEHFEPGARVLVAACGGGREVLGLLRADFDAHGYEPHQALVAYGSDFLAQHGHPSRIHPSPRDTFPTAAESCDAVVVGWGGYSLMHARQRRISFLTGAAERLPSKAPVLLSFFHRSADSRELLLTKAIADALRRARRREPVELGDTLAPNQVHVFARAQLADELAEARLDLVDYRITGRADETASYAAAVARVR